MNNPIRVVIAEDQGMVLGALAALLEIEPDIVVVGQARHGKAALEAVAQHRPDVLITDIEMPEMSGLEVAAELKRQSLEHAHHHPHHVCALRLFAPRAGSRRIGVFIDRLAR